MYLTRMLGGGDWIYLMGNDGRIIEAIDWVGTKRGLDRVQELVKQGISIKN